MTTGGQHERDEVDRAFADLVAGYHLTADRPEPPPPAPPTPFTPAPSDATWAADHPLFSYTEPDPEPEVEVEERFVPDPPAPLPKPAWPTLIGWLGMGYAVLAMLAVVIGVRLPPWVGWLALVGFVGGFALLVSRLPRTRPPDAGDGAVL